jgi:sugar lactone lactonase YvrE
MRKIIIQTFLIVSVFCAFNSKAQVITTVAGTGSFSYNGDSIQATSADLNYPRGVVADASGNIYIADYRNARIRKVNTSGIITTVGGNGTFGYSGDGGAATSATINNPNNVTLDAAGNLYFSDEGNNAVRKINTSGIITTIAGVGSAGSSGDGGPATAAGIYTPSGLAFDATGNMYIAEFIGHRIRKINTSGTISTIVGNGTGAYTGDGGPATAAQLKNPWGIVCDAGGNLLICDNNNHCVRKINSSGVISTIAGTGVSGFSGDGGQATSARLSYPEGIAIDASGNIYIGELNHRIRRISTSGIISTIAGTGTSGYSGDGGMATAAMMNDPMGICFDPSGNLYIADQQTMHVRKISACPLPVAGTVSGPSFVCAGSTISMSTTGSGGSWSSSSAGIASINTSGVVTGIAAGLTIISYTVTNSCGSTADTQLIRVGTVPSGNILGPDTVCVADTGVFLATTAGGTWSVSNTAIATVDIGGTMTGVSVGSVTLSYSMTNSCGTTVKTHPVYIRPSSACGLGFANHTKNDEWIVYPNPTHGIFNIIPPSEHPETELFIYDAMGKLLNQYNVGQNSIKEINCNISKYPHGNYLLKYVSNNNVVVQRIIYW